MFRIAIINSKGGSGKTTLATNLASYYASHQLKTTLIDYDSQGSSTYWVERRPKSKNPIEVIAAFKQTASVTRTWFLRPERGTQRVIVDSPSGLDVRQFKQTLNDSDAILIPVLPSMIDIHAVTQFISEVLLHGKVKQNEGRIAVLANRARKNTLAYHKLESFLDSLGIPFIATLRDSQDYVKATEAGIGILELPKANPKDIKSWQPILAWLQQCESKKSYSETTAAHG